ncbi:type VI secretion system tip protein VgrG, partial [Halomonas kenyensis]|nr:type VI secretion system tip protein VgrG [Halomonas kenyensis]
KAGGSFLKLDPSGITIVGAQVKINSGGSPGSGSGQGAAAPELPRRADGEEHARIAFSGSGPSQQAQLVEAEGLGERELLVDVTSGGQDGQQVRLRKARTSTKGEQNG